MDFIIVSTNKLHHRRPLEFCCNKIFKNFGNLSNWYCTIMLSFKYSISSIVFYSTDDQKCLLYKMVKCTLSCFNYSILFRFFKDQMEVSKNEQNVQKLLCCKIFKLFNNYSYFNFHNLTHGEEDIGGRMALFERLLKLSVFFFT